VGHSFFDWGFYVLLIAFLPVCLCAVYLVLSLLALTILSLHAISSQNSITHCCHCQVNSKRAQQWRRRALPFSLVVRCLTHARLCPPRMDGTLFMSLHISKHLHWMSRCLCTWLFFMSQRNSKQSNGVEPFGGLLKYTLDDFLRSDRNYLQLPRLLSKFKSIDNEKNISSCIARVVALWGTFENCPVGGGKLNPRSLILIWDTGASYGLTPFCSDCIDYVECDNPVQDVTKVNKVIVIGTTLHKFTNTDSKPVFLPCVSYRLPQTVVRLFSPQINHQMHGGYSKVYAQSIQMKMCTSTISITIKQGLTNLPVVHDSFISEKGKHGLGPLMHSGLSQTRIPVLDFFWEIDKVVSSIFTQSEKTFFPCFPCVGNSENTKLTSPQKELLLWHWKLGINMYWFQELMHERTF
jgi:hypothetical protein